MKLGVVIPFWGREAIAQFCLRRLRRAADVSVSEVTIVAVTDEAENGRIATSFGCELVPHPNTYLSTKWNAGVAHLRDRVDAVVILGSDGWVCDRFFDAWAARLVETPVVGVLDSWQVCVHRPEALYWPGYHKERRRGETIGAGRALRADVLNSIDWNPWLPGLHRGLDWSMRNVLQGHGISLLGGLTQEEAGVRVLGIKSEVGITPFERFLKTARLVSREEALAPFPADEVAGLEAFALNSP